MAWRAAKGILHAMPLALIRVPRSATLVNKRPADHTLGVSSLSLASRQDLKPIGGRLQAS